MTGCRLDASSRAGSRRYGRTHHAGGHGGGQGWGRLPAGVAGEIRQVHLSPPHWERDRSCGSCSAEWRSTLAYRVTDKAVHDTTHLMPLSVVADRIAYTAMRCAGLLAQLARKGQPVDRCGTGVVVEVYQPR